MTSHEILKKYFGYDSFRTGQEYMINAILEHRDALAIMPTGAGKSICYQVPAMLLSGITLVISPLISLMQDQVKTLNEAGIHAAYINSSLTESQISKALQYAARGQYKIIYVAPERLETEEFRWFAANVAISMITVDEAHCISQWGQDFRPSYLKIVDFVNFLPYRPIVSAFTATATKEVKEDIICALGLQSPATLVTGFDRENLFYEVEKGKAKDAYILEYIKEHSNESGVIYCATRKNVDKLYELLDRKGIAVTRYHAGLGAEERKTNQDAFIYDRKPIIVATNAFGMGIDKSNVRFVIHYNMPQSMENYYQEAGRAGRDGEAAQCILLFSAQDMMINKFLLEQKDFTDIDFEDVELIRQRDSQRLHKMEAYCQTTDCLRTHILTYFGEKMGAPCGNCGNCQKEFVEMDMTKEAKWIINCVTETKGRYGLNVVVGTLLGAKRAKLQEFGTTEYQSYGVLRESSEGMLKKLITQMIEEGYLYQTDDRYSLLKIGKEVYRLHNEATTVKIKVHIEEDNAQGKNMQKKSGSGSMKNRSTDKLTTTGFELFEKLRQLRLEIAREENMPPYIIFNDKTLIDMCTKSPQTKNEMMQVSGVGEHKYHKYGQRFMEMIAAFVEEHPRDVLTMEVSEEGNRQVSRTAKGRKQEFYLTEKQAQGFVYAEKYYISDIKDELNRLRDAESIKQVTIKEIFAFLSENYFVKEEYIEGIWKKCIMPKGAEMGIEAVEKVSQKGTIYEVLYYPRQVQEMVVNHFVKGEDD